MIHPTVSTSSIMWRWLALLLPGLIVPALPAMARWDAHPAEQAIQKAVDDLYRRQKPDGSWELLDTPRNNLPPDDPRGLQFGARSAMAVWALQAAGENPQTAKIQRALAWISKCDYQGTRAMSMKLQMWNAINDRLTNEQKQILRRDAQLLLNSLKIDKDNRGMHDHWLDPAKGDSSPACSCYGIQGLWAADKMNLDVPNKYWEIVDAAWRKDQNKDGAWSYTRPNKNAKPDDPGTKSTISMTAAGLAALCITQDHLAIGADERKGPTEDPGIQRGIAWIARHHNQLWNEKDSLFALHQIARAGRSLGLKRFGDFDWYPQGSAYLLNAQHPDGSWGDVPETVWAILFLLNGRDAIMMNKLQYTVDLRGNGPQCWNQRPRDLTNLLDWMSRWFCDRKLAWQTVSPRDNSDDLHDAPVLYISGNNVLAFSPEDKAKLKRYIETGGMIVGHADYNSLAFAHSFEKLAKELFPQHQFRILPDDHFIHTCYFNRKNWPEKSVPKLMGCTNGARELMILIAQGDPARFWQMGAFAGERAKPPAELAANLCLYAADLGSLRDRRRGYTHIVLRDDKIKPRHTVHIARLDHGGPNWDPEPAAWERLTNVMHNTRDVELVVKPVTLGENKLVTAFKLAHLTGAAAFELKSAQRQELKAFVEAGGTLVIDAAGGSTAFKDSAEAMLHSLFGDAAKALADPLPFDHKIYAIDRKLLDRNVYRRFTRKTLLHNLANQNLAKPSLRGILIDGRIAVIFSPEDLTVGLVGMPVDGIYGYEPAAATHLMGNIILHAARITP